MEEKRPGQEPEKEQRDSGQEVTARAAPAPHDAPPTGMEKQMIEEGQKRAKRDREELRKTGHGDHKGESGF